MGIIIEDFSVNVIFRIYPSLVGEKKLLKIIVSRMILSMLALSVITLDVNATFAFGYYDDAKILEYSPAIENATATLQSLEATGASQNIGTMQLGATVFTLPNSTTLPTGTYLLEYNPTAGYQFFNWTVTGSIIVQNLTAQTTNVTVNGNGTIRAFYRGCIVNLSSRHWQNSSYNLGTIAFGVVNYSLPGTLIGLPQTDYFLQYIPLNSSYVFQWWEQSGNVIPWNFTSNSTILTVYGDGNITAVYALITEPQPPFMGECNTLYVDKGPMLVPPFMWSLKSSHIPSWASTGADKQEVVVYSPPVPTIYLARYLNITAYVGIDPPWNAESLYLEFGYNYSGQYYLLGNGTFPISSDGVYRMTIDSLLGEYPGEVGVIPEGSICKFWVVVTFYRQPWGTFKLYYGPNQPSRVELYEIRPEESVTLGSREENFASENLGEIRLGNDTFSLPNSTIVLDGTHSLEYIAATGYAFLNWTTSGDISIQDPFSSLTNVTIIGNGSIVVFYRFASLLPTIRVDPETLQVRPSSSFAVDVEIVNVSDLYLWEFKLYYRNDIVDVVQITEGSLLRTGGTTVWADNSNPNYNSTYGLVHVGASLLGDIPGVNGTGVIASISFATVAVGNSTLDIVDTIILNSTLIDIPHYTFDGYVSVILVHDVAILAVAPSKNIIGQGYTMYVNATIRNQGDFNESFNITCYSNSSIIGEQAVALVSGANMTLAFVWNTSGVAKGNYTVKAVADTLSGETDTEDNMLLDGWLFVTIAGDVTGATLGVPDGIVDMRDIGALCSVFGATPPSPRWDPNMDINNDDLINMRDIGIACKNFMKT